MNIFKMTKKRFVFAALVISAGILNGALPEYKPPFAVNELKRVKPELKIGNFIIKGKAYEQPSLVAGHKRIGLRELYGKYRADRDYLIGVYVDKEEVFRICFWGSYRGKDKWGFPFRSLPDSPAKVRWSKEDNSISYSKAYQLPDGSKAMFSFQLKSLPGGKVALTWKPGISNEKMKSIRGYSLAPWLELPNNYRSNRIEINGKLFTPSPKEKLAETRGKEQESYKGAVKEVTFNKVTPEKKISVIFHGAYGTLRERYWSDKNIQAMIRTWPKPWDDNRKIIIDFGSVLPQEEHPPAINGIDFWKSDATHVPVAPTRNLMPNASFNQGLRYYSWMYGGAKYAPSDIRRYSIAPNDGRNGGKCLLINPVQGASASLRSFPLPLRKGKTYTFSCYAKGEYDGQRFAFCPISVSAKQFPHSWQRRKESIHRLTKEWKRYSYTFKYLTGAVCVLFSNLSGKKLWIDDVQVEEGAKASDFVTVPMDGNLLTSDPDNLIDKKNKIDAKFITYGGSGKIRLTLYNFYRKKLWEGEYNVKSGETVPLPFDKIEVGTGNFVLKACFLPEHGKPYYDYYRFNVMIFLKNEHATKNMFGSEIRPAGRISRANDYARLMMVSGMGSTGYGRMYNQHDDFLKVLKQNKIANMVYTMGGHSGFVCGSKADRAFLQNIVTKAKKITPDDEKRIEAITYLYVKENPQAKAWSFNHEEEGRSPLIMAGNFAEWAKVLAAFRRGVKRANPDALVIPDGGTTNFHSKQKRVINEKYLQSTAAKDIRWDGFATHVYGSLDGTKAGRSDLDEIINAFIELLNKYGYKKEPVYLTEGFNLPGQNIPAWGCLMWNDGYMGGKASYDFGLREFNQAAWIARSYLICLKYWPRVQRMDCWNSRFFIDYYLTPYAMMNGINTLGNLLGNPKFVGDVKPAAGVRGYVFQDEKGRGLAAVWCVSDKVENGLSRGPELEVKFPGGKLPEFIDLMGNQRTASRQNGIVKIPLTQAPVFIRGGKPEQLLAALRNADVIGGESSLRLNISAEPDGKILTEIFNMSGREQNGTVSCNGKTMPFHIKANGNVILPVAGSKGTAPGKMYTFHDLFMLRPEKGSLIKKEFKLDYFYVPFAAGKPDWSRIPKLPLENVFLKKGFKYGGKSDVSATFQTAWSQKDFYLRVEVADNRFVVEPERLENTPYRRQRLYDLDGCLEVYFDTGANGRSAMFHGFDDDDYRYDFSYGNPEGKSGKGLVNRLHEVNIQLGGGVSMPGREEANREVKCKFTRTSTGFVYEITFPQRYIVPLDLKAGSSAGFALFLHDKDDASVKPGGKGLSLAGEKGKHVNHAPQLWPLMILKK